MRFPLSRLTVFFALVNFLTALAFGNEPCPPITNLPLNTNFAEPILAKIEQSFLLKSTSVFTDVAYWQGQVKIRSLLEHHQNVSEIGEIGDVRYRKCKDKPTESTTTGP